ncbi:MAG: hypothetical protein JJU45_03675, partial [Acidimicrobiia bacterium]|nr:hypothetical protein [Acidimicrobiia bacterium]
VALVIVGGDGRLRVAAEPAFVQRLLHLLGGVADATHAADLLGLSPFVETNGDLFGHWQHLAGQPDPGLDGWSQRHLDQLAILEAEAPAATVGSDLLHVDVRTDNTILANAGPGGDVLVDWPGASLGAAWVDLVGLLPALELDGGPPPWDVLPLAPTARGADPDAVDAFVVALAGYFTRMSLLPPPPGLPNVRAFQAAQGEIARAWTARRLRLG